MCDAMGDRHVRKYVYVLAGFLAFRIAGYLTIIVASSFLIEFAARLWQIRFFSRRLLFAVCLSALSHVRWLRQEWLTEARARKCRVADDLSFCRFWFSFLFAVLLPFLPLFIILPPSQIPVYHVKLRGCVTAPSLSTYRARLSSQTPTAEALLGRKGARPRGWGRCFPGAATGA